MTWLLTSATGRSYNRLTSSAPLFGPSSPEGLNFFLGEIPRIPTASSILLGAKGSGMKSKARRIPGASRAAQADEELIDVLLVEDDPSVLEMYRLKLELDGYRVSTALDGEDGLKKAGDFSPDIIFLDIRLPKMDGLEVLRKLRAQDKTREIPVIILSNYDEEDLIARGLRLGAHEYLIKARTTPTSLSEGIEDWLKE